MTAAQTTPLADQELVARVAVGDDVALNLLRARYERSAYAMAFGILGEPVGAEHAVSEAFLEAQRAAGRFDPRGGSVRAWITAIARQRAEMLATSLT